MVQQLAVRQRDQRLIFRVGQAASGHPGDLHLLDRSPHVLRPGPVPGHVLVVENGDHAAGLPEDVYHLVEELPSRVELLALCVQRVGAVLPYDHDAVNRQRIPAATERGRQRRIERHGMLLRGVDADVVLENLHQVHRHHFAARLLEMVVELLAFQELRAVAEAVAAGTVGGENDGQFGPAFRRVDLHRCVWQ
jgi:hypothetical protein